MPELMICSDAAPVCGVDEAGRGPLAGPVCAAAVILPPGFCPEGLDDSKKLTETKRERLYEELTAHALSWSVAFADVEEIARLNILQATFLAMRRAVTGLTTVPALVLVDGNRDPGLGLETRCEVGGDGRFACIAAASVLAKVSRDRVMRDYDAQYPGYGFADHKGYGTRRHVAALRELGVTPIHRSLFLRKLGL